MSISKQNMSWDSPLGKCTDENSQFKDWYRNPSQFKKINKIKAKHELKFV